MVSIQTQKIIMIMVVIFVVLYFGYRTFMLPPVIPPSSYEVTEETLGKNILSLVDRFKAISIDQSFFSSPLFTSLRDYSVTLTPEVQGRINPFAQIGVESASGR